MSKVFLVVENDEGLDDVVKVFAKRKKAEAFAFVYKDDRYAQGVDVDVAVVEMEVE